MLCVSLTDIPILFSIYRNGFHDSLPTMILDKICSYIFAILQMVYTNLLGNKGKTLFTLLPLLPYLLNPVDVFCWSALIIYLVL